MRRFEEVKSEFLAFPDVATRLPERSDSRSAGYDFYSKENFIIAPGESHTTYTDVKAWMYFDNVLKIYTRSGNGCKYGIVLRNGTGIIDSSYAGNRSNDGNIGVCLLNTGDKPFEVHIGDRIAQGVFERYLICDDDKFLGKEEKNERIGGFGSTGK